MLTGLAGTTGVVWAGPPCEGMEESGYAIWKGSCLVGNDPLPKLGRLEPEGYAGRYLYCQVAFWAKLLPDSEEIPLPFPLF